MSTGLLSKLEHDKDITIHDLTNECNTLLSTKRETMLEQKQNSSLTANVRSKKKKRKRKRKANCLHQLVSFMVTGIMELFALLRNVSAMNILAILI